MERPDGLRAASRGWTFSALLLSGALVFVALGVSFYVYQSDRQRTALSLQVSELAGAKSVLAQQSERLNALLTEKEEALAQAQKQNFGQELATAQESLRDANTKMNAMVRDKAALENSNIMLDNRLKNTTNELMKTLEELKQARATLMGIEDRYKGRLSEVSQNLKLKDEQMTRFQDQIREKDGSAVIVEQKEKDASVALRNYQAQLQEMEKSLAALNQSLYQKQQVINEQSAAVEQLKKENLDLKGRAGMGALDPSARAALEQQVSTSGVELSRQQEALRSLEEKVATLSEELAGRQEDLFEKEKELTARAQEISDLRQQVASLKVASPQSAKTEALLSETRRQLEQKVRALEGDKKDLEARMEELKKAGRAKAESSDPMADKNFRVLTETLVKKEELIKQLENELEELRVDKLARAGSIDANENRLAELEILVNTLTRQLGDYAGIIEEKDAELKASAAKVVTLIQELEAQKVASMALQKELADARSLQEKTFSSLSQLMGLNANAAVSSRRNAGAIAASEAQAVEKTTKRDAARNAQEAQKKAEELRKQVEVLLEQKS